MLPFPQVTVIPFEVHFCIKIQTPFLFKMLNYEGTGSSFVSLNFTYSESNSVKAMYYTLKESYRVQFSGLAESQFLAIVLFMLDIVLKAVQIISKFPVKQKV